jgi:hypothetical protein
MRTSIGPLFLVFWASGSADAHEPALSRFNFRDDARPIFLRHCGACHRAEGVAPMSLLDYQEAVPWANAIKLALLEGRMPPFLPGDAGPPLRDERRLTAKELDTLIDWAGGATPEGESLAPGEDAARSELDSPDLVLRPDADVVIEESASEETACAVLRTGLSAPRVVTSLEVLPESSSLLRRATILVGDSCARGEPLATWLPDRGRVSFPDGLGRKLEASSSLAVELRYVKGWGQEGKRLRDRPSVGLWFAFGAASVRTVPIERPILPLTETVRLVALYPSAGDDAPLRVEAVDPAGASRLLLSIEKFDPVWSEKYFFRDPITIPSGSALRVSHEGVWADLASAK